MMRPKMYSGIAIAVASIVVVGAVAEENPRMLTSRFLNSVEQASAVVAAAATANAINVDSTSSSFHATPMMVLDEEVSGESDSVREDNENSFSSKSQHYQRRELSWWSIALQFGKVSSFEASTPACPSANSLGGGRVRIVLSLLRLHDIISHPLLFRLFA